VASPLSPECQQLLKLLEDYEWHFVDEVMLKLIGQVAPGRAIRRYDLSSKIREEKFGPRVGPELSDREKVKSGARTLANHAMNSMRKRYVEVDDNGDVRLCRLRREPLPVRIRNVPRDPRTTDRVAQSIRDAALAAKRAEAAAEIPGATPDPLAPSEASEPLSCLTCGLYVVNPDQHLIWHQERTEQDAARIEEMIRRVLGEELRGFRQGLQSFLIARFAALEVVLGERIPTKRW